MGSSITYEERTGANACELYYAYDKGGKLYGFYYDGSSNDGFYYYKRNLQGDIIGILNSTGTEVVKYKYDTWGKHDSSDISGTLASTVGADNPFRYRGYYYDNETGLYYLNQRYYNPEWGRFINADTYMGQTGDLLGHNVFAYCANNPVMFSDPSGNSATLAIILVTAAAVALYGILTTDLAQQQVNLNNTFNRGCGNRDTELIFGAVLLNTLLTKSYDLVADQYDPDPYARPGQKKQGRERKNKVRSDPKWKPRSGKRRLDPPKKHTPGKGHKKYQFYFDIDFINGFF